MNKTIPKDLSIPPFLKRRQTPENKKRVAKLVAESRNPTVVLGGDKGVKRRDFNQPMGVSDEEWAKMKAKNDAEKKAKTTERLRGLKKERAPKKLKRAGLISVGDIAKKVGMLPREARGILRGLKEKKPDCGWAFDEAGAARIEKLLKDAPKKVPGEKKVREPKKAPKIPGPDETEWALSSKDKKKWRKDVKKRTKPDTAEELAEPVKKKAASAAGKALAAAKKKGKKK